MWATIIPTLVKIVMGAIALGVGIWYVYASISGDSIGYTSLDGFLNAIGACDANGVCDIASANGCFMCGYIEKLFGIIGNAATTFWGGVINSIWVLMPIGFGIAIFIWTAGHLFEASKANADFTSKETKLDWAPLWKKIQSQGIRIIIVGALIGATGFMGTDILGVIANVIITPVLYIASLLSMAATGVISNATCALELGAGADVLSPVFQPLMCIMGNLNTVMLAGVSGGFTLMNFSWAGLGGGVMTWVAGLAMVILFLYIGFGLFARVLNIVFKLVFVVVFMPLIVASYAFNETWKLAKGIVSNSINMLASSAVKLVQITLEIVLLYAVVAFTADEYFPGPNDGYSAILPPGIVGAQNINPNDRAMDIMSVFSKCEKVALNDKEKFRDCFIVEKRAVERKHPGAFDFMNDGFFFILFFMAVYFVYAYAVKPEIEKVFKLKEDDNFRFGDWLMDFGKSVWKLPEKVVNIIGNARKPKK